jgi:membrane protein
MAERVIAQPRRRAALPRPGSWLTWLLDFVEAAKLSWRDNVPGMAATIAFFAFLSMVPLLILLLAFMGDILRGTIPAREIRGLFHTVMPGLSDHAFLTTYWYPVQHSQMATKVVGVLSLLLGTMGLHDAVDWGVNRLWQSTNGRPFWMGKARGAATIVWVIVFAVLSLWLTWLWAVLLSGLHAPSLIASLWLSIIPALMLDTCVFAGLYKLTPTCETRIPPVLIAGAVSAVLWEASKIGFGWWILGTGHYNRVYGPLAASVIVMLWLWISSIIFLYGAALAATLQRRHWTASD